MTCTVCNMYRADKLLHKCLIIIKYRPCFTAILMKLEGIFNCGMNFLLIKLDLRRLPGNNIPPGRLNLTLLP